MKMTYHAQMERTDRLVYIAMTVGFGEVVFEHRTHEHRECITDTGVLLVKPLDEEKLITAYIVGMDKAMALYRNTYGNQRMPHRLYNTIRNNAQHIKKQNIVVFG